MNKTFLLMALALLPPLGAWAQASVARDVPPTFRYDQVLYPTAPVTRAEPPASAEQLRREDLERIKDGHPLRVAVPAPVDVRLDARAAHWLALPDGHRVWQHAVQAPGAGSLLLTFDTLALPPGGILYAYTPDRAVLHRVTPADNPDGGPYALPRIPSGEVILEYARPAASDNAPSARIALSTVGYVYRDTRSWASDLACFINITCEEGDVWRQQAKGVVSLDVELYTQDERGQWGWGWYMCSGSLVNNVRQDGTPYLLTAHHCFEGAEERTYRTLRTYFFLDPPADEDDCQAQLYENDFYQTLVGVELLADVPIYGGSDGILLRLKKDIPADWDIYYNGWDARGIAANSGVCIHHPYGMVKKISTYTRPLTPARWSDEGGNGAWNASWEVHWAQTPNGWSVTYGGSSGSPLFNEDGLIVGTLSGGESYCDYPYYSDLFGKFSYHWDQYPDTLQHFSRYLDPDGTGTLVLEGLAPQPQSSVEAPQAPAASEAFATPDGVVIRRPADTPVAVSVYDLTGRPVWSGTMSGHEMQLPRSLFGPGVHCVRVDGDTHKVMPNP